MRRVVLMLLAVTAGLLLVALLPAPADHFGYARPVPDGLPLRCFVLYPRTES